jgi:hypothetical protein
MGGFFHWRYSGALIFFFYALAIAMISIGVAVESFHKLFILAYCCFACSLIWAIGWWLTSRPLESKKPKLTKKQRQGKEPVSYASYKAWKWGVPLLMAAIFFGSVKLTSNIELDRELSLLGGWLVPDKLASPPDPCAKWFQRQPNTVTVFWGDNVASEETTFPHIILKIKGEPKIVLDRSSKGALAITLDVFDQHENIIAEIDHNHFTVNPNNYFEKIQKDKSSLIVISQNKKEKVLDIHYLNPSAIKILGKFRYPGIQPIESTDNGLNIFGAYYSDHSCIGYSGEVEFNAN